MLTTPFRRRRGWIGTKPRRMIVERFWSKVASMPSGCWEWRGTIIQRGIGYGQFGLPFHGRTKVVLAHRFAYELQTARDVPTSVQVNHRCDNRRCVRRAHLFEGNHRVNADDARRKGRMAVGVRCPQSKLTEDIVERIRSAHAQGATNMPTLAKRYGVNTKTISDVVRGVNWKHVGGPTSRRDLRAKLTPPQIQTIRLRRWLGTSTSRLSRLYGVSRTNVKRITDRRIWKRLD